MDLFNLIIVDYFGAPSSTACVLIFLYFISTPPFAQLLNILIPESLSKKIIDKTDFWALSIDEITKKDIYDQFDLEKFNLLGIKVPSLKTTFICLLFLSIPYGIHFWQLFSSYESPHYVKIIDFLWYRLLIHYPISDVFLLFLILFVVKLFKDDKYIFFALVYLVFSKATQNLSGIIFHIHKYYSEGCVDCYLNEYYILNCSPILPFEKYPILALLYSIFSPFLLLSILTLIFKWIAYISTITINAYVNFLYVLSTVITKFLFKASEKNPVKIYIYAFVEVVKIISAFIVFYFDYPQK